MPTSVFPTLTSPTDTNPQVQEPVGHIHWLPHWQQTLSHVSTKVLISPACLSTLSPGSPSSGLTIHPAAPARTRGPPWTIPSYSFISHLSPSLSLPGLDHWHLLPGQQQHSFPDGPRLDWNLSPHCHPGFFSPKHKYAMQSFSCLNKFRWTR